MKIVFWSEKFRKKIKQWCSEQNYIRVVVIQAGKQSTQFKENGAILGKQKKSQLAETSLQ